MTGLFQGLIDFLEALVRAHPGAVVALVIGATLASIIGSSLPAPDVVWPEKKGKWYFVYLTVFSCLHIVAANFGRIFPWLRISTNGKSQADPPTTSKAA